MSSKNILIIDDEEQIVMVLKTYLENECGYRVTAAFNAMDGLTRLIGQRFSVVIADVNMPGMDGLELVMRIKASYPGVHVIMISGRGDADVIVRAMKLGAEDYVTKPFELADVGARVAKLADRNDTQPTAKQSKQTFHSMGDYELISQLGAGGMGIVYKARQKSTGIYVALKVLFPKLIRDEVAFQRFLREARLMGELDHPNIVRGLDVGQIEGNHFIAMELVDGKGLDEVIDEHGPLGLPYTADITRQLFAALNYLYSRNIVHRDIKPTNILITHDNVAKLVDMGLTKHVNAQQTVTEQGMAVGTAGFMPPEAIFSDDALDIRSDIYALGGTVYYMLTGELPFQGTAHEIFEKQRRHVPSIDDLNVEVPPELDRFVQKMMAIKPKDRFQSPGEMILEFEQMRLPGCGAEA